MIRVAEADIFKRVDKIQKCKGAKKYGQTV
jgi:hypothetical protein